MPGPGRGRTGAQVRSQTRSNNAMSATNITALRRILVQAGMSASDAALLAVSGLTNRQLADAVAAACKTFRKPS